MKKTLLIFSVLGLGTVQTSGAVETKYQPNNTLASITNSSNTYGASKNPYLIKKNVIEHSYVDQPKEESSISYKDTTIDELESYKYKSVTVMNSFKSTYPTLIMTITNQPSKNFKDSTVILSPILRGSTAYCYRGCSLMVKFDDKEAKKYEFKSNITGEIYILDSSHNKDFINNAKSSSVLKTKISFATFNLPIENIDFKKIEF